ncbi:MAG TPA: hypothetical protein VIU87_17865 [Mycobacterium sp.]
MMERPHEPRVEALSTVGLLLNVAAVPAFALGLAGLSTGTSGLAAATVAVAVVTFAASLVCFTVGGRRLDVRRTEHVRSPNIVL